MTKTSRTGMGAAIGCFVGLLSYFFIGFPHDYVPSAALSLPWPLIGAGFGFFSGVEMSKGRKTRVGALVGAGLAGAMSLLLLLIGGRDLADLAGRLLLVNLPLWALIWAAAGAFTGGGKATTELYYWSAGYDEQFRRLRERMTRR
jgi:hypothetical protein